MSRMIDTAYAGRLGQRPPARHAGLPRVWLAAALLALLSGPLTLLPPAIAVALVLAPALVALVAVAPPAGAYLLLATTPLIAGIDRGQLIPALRPSEAIAAIVIAGLVCRGLFELARGAPLRVRLRSVDRSLLAFAVAGSVLPLLWLAARGLPATSDDLLYALQPWKYVAVFLIIRVAIRSEAEVRRCLWIILSAAVLVAAIALLQSLNVLGVRGLLAGTFALDEVGSSFDVTRASSTLGSPIALADVMIYSAAIAIALALQKTRARPVLLVVAIILLLAVGAAGQYSGFLGVVVAVLALGTISRRLRHLVLATVCALPIAALVTWPVISARLSGFESYAGLPPSWYSRWDNLNGLFWPKLGDFNWVLGVRPSARVPAPESLQGWIWIESGHTWLLWTGGIFLVAAFFVFVWCALSATAAVARSRSDGIGVAAAAGFTAFWVMSILMILDHHIALRGGADLLFSLLALSLVSAARPSDRRLDASAPDEDAERLLAELDRAHELAQDAIREVEAEREANRRLREELAEAREQLARLRDGIEDE